jgi:excisionase family DNA binding protein
MIKESPMKVFRDIRNLLLCQKNVLTIEELCLYTGFSKGWIYKLTSNNLIPYHKSPTGKTLFFDRAVIEKWLLSNPINNY